MFRPKSFLVALSKADVAFVVIGGMAATAQGAAYVTQDLELCYERGQENLERLSNALRPFKPYLRGAPPDLPFTLDAATLRSGLNFTLMTEDGPIDLLGEVAGLGTFEVVKAHSEKLPLMDCDVWVLSLEGLIRSKEAAGRTKDLLVLPELKALQAMRSEPPDARS